MFKIVLKDPNPDEATQFGLTVWAHGESELVFLGDIRENECARLSGIQVRNEYLKTHWERAQEWQDVTGELEVKNNSKYLRNLGEESIANITLKNHRFVKVETYVIPDEGWGCLGPVTQSNWRKYRTTLLRVERKVD